jgi:two-component system, NarL family, nitrate/nitrite response regulator NarL
LASDNLVTVRTGDREVAVVVIAPYPSLRAGLRAMAEQTPGITVVAEAVDDDLEIAYTPDAFIIDVDPDHTAITTRIDDRYPGTAFLLLVDTPAVFRRVGGRPEGATAVLLKDADAAQIGAALLAAVQGLVVLDPEIARQTTPQPASYAATDGADDALTERERQVLELLALGLPNKTIAVELGISEHTAKFHVGTIMSKLGAASRTEAVAIAARRGVLVL